MNLNYLRDNHKNYLLELLQKYEKMFDGTLGKYTGADYKIQLKEDPKPYTTKGRCRALYTFSYSKHSQTNSQERS